MNDDGDAELSSHESVAPATNSSPPPEPYQCLLGFAILYAILLFLCALGMGNSIAPFFPMAAGVYSTVLLLALWSVFGPGNYLKRLFWAHLIGAIPALGLTLGVYAVSNDQGSEFGNIWSALVIPLISVVPISLGAQLPFWFFRSLFGWQLVNRGQHPERSFDLRDVFVLTFLFAFSFAVPQMSVNLQWRANGSDNFDQDQRITVSKRVVQSDGRSTPVDRVLTKEDVAEHQREQRQRDQMVSYAIHGRHVVGAVGVTLLSIPIVLFVFRSKVTASGCALTGLYVFGIWSVIIASTAIGFGGLPPEVLLYLGVLLALCACAVAVPLVVARETGLQLTSPKRFAREQLKG